MATATFFTPLKLQRPLGQGLVECVPISGPPQYSNGKPRPEKDRDFHKGPLLGGGSFLHNSPALMKGFAPAIFSREVWEAWGHSGRDPGLFQAFSV